MSTATFPILVVEDNEMNQRLITHQLKRIGFDDIKVLSNGIDALAWLETSPCSLVLADCQMAPIDGYEMTRRIREGEKARGGHVIVIAVTAGAMENDRKRCAEAGMDGYLPKPTQIATLKEALGPWIPKVAS